MMKIDSIGRALSLELAAGRLAVGSAALLATRPALRLAGFGETDSSGRALARVLGARDLALAALTVAVREDRGALRATALAAAALDAGDTVAFALAARNPELRRAAVGSAASAAIAAGAGFYAARRLS
jgi:hypothetical protein